MIAVGEVGRITTKSAPLPQFVIAEMGLFCCSKRGGMQYQAFPRLAVVLQALSNGRFETLISIIEAVRRERMLVSRGSPVETSCPFRKSPCRKSVSRFWRPAQLRLPLRPCFRLSERPAAHMVWRKRRAGRRSQFDAAATLRVFKSLNAETSNNRDQPEFVWRELRERPAPGCWSPFLFSLFLSSSSSFSLLFSFSSHLLLFFSPCFSFLFFLSFSPPPTSFFVALLGRPDEISYSCRKLHWQPSLSPQACPSLTKSLVADARGPYLPHRKGSSETPPVAFLSPLPGVLRNPCSAGGGCKILRGFTK